MCLIVFDWQPATENGPLLTLAANATNSSAARARR